MKACIGDCLRKQCRSILEKGCPKKGNLDIFAILAMRGNLNLDLHLDLQCPELEGILMFYTRGSWSILRHVCRCMLKMHQIPIRQKYTILPLTTTVCTSRNILCIHPQYFTERCTAGCSISSEQASADIKQTLITSYQSSVRYKIGTPREPKSARHTRTRTPPTAQLLA